LAAGGANFVVPQGCGKNHGKNPCRDIFFETWIFLGIIPKPRFSGSDFPLKNADVMIFLGGKGGDFASQSIPKSLNGAGVFTCIYINPTKNFSKWTMVLDCLGKENQRKSGIA